MTVTSAIKPSLPLVDTPRCDLRPTPGTALQPTKRRERFSCPGVKALRSHGALLEQVYYKEQGMSSVLASQAGCTPAGVQLSIPMPEGRGLSPHFGKNSKHDAHRQKSPRPNVNVWIVARSVFSPGN